MFETAIAWLERNADLLGGIGTLFAAGTFLVTNGRSMMQRVVAGKSAGNGAAGPTGGYTGPDAPPPAPDYGGKQAIAILPFKEMGSLPDHFTEGLIDDLVGEFRKAGFATPGRTAVSRLLAMDAELHEITRTLGAAFVLEGSIRVQDQKFRVSVQLMDKSGATVWTDRYNMAGDDLMAMQDTLAAKIAEGVASHKGESEAAHAAVMEPAAPTYKTREEARAARRAGYSGKSRLVSLILCFFVGMFGVHRFYVGRWFTGILYLLTLGFFGIGWLMDMILIPCGALTDGKSRPVRLWFPETAPVA